MIRMIRMWVNGTRAPGDMYADLLGVVFGVKFEQLDHQLQSTLPPEDGLPRWRRQVATNSMQGIVDQDKEILMSAEESSRFADFAERSNIGPHTLDQFMADMRRIVTVYPNRPVYPVFVELRTLRDRIFEKLEGRQNPRQSRDLYLIAGILNGVMANASFDLGFLHAAQTQSRTAFLCAELAGVNWLRAWIRGTQALISYYENQPVTTIQLAEDGQRYSPESGTSLVRLACLEARAHGLLRDSRGVDQALAQAERARTAVVADDEPGGMMAFPLAKQHYHASTARLWLGETGAARTAERDAARSVLDHEETPLEDRRLGELTLARLDLVTARLAVGHIDGIATEVRAVLGVAQRRPIESVTRRLRQVDAVLGRPRYGGSAETESVREEIQALVGSSTRPALPRWMPR
jgi:hypothetical protein